MAASPQLARKVTQEQETIAIDPSFPLHRAVKNNNLNAIASLLQSNPDMYQQDNLGNVPLFYIFEKETFNLRILEAFIKHGFDINKPCFSNGHRLLDCLVLAHYQFLNNGGRLTEIRYLFSKRNKPDVNLTSNGRKGSYTPLQYAIEFGCDKELVELLINHGAKTNVTTLDGKTLIDLAKVHREKGSLVVQLLKKKQAENNLALLKAVRSKDLKAVIDSLEAGANPRAPAIRNTTITIFQYACAHSPLSIVQAILEEHPFLLQEKSKSTQKSPVQFAKDNHLNSDVIKYLLGKSMLDPSVRDDYAIETPKTSVHKAVVFQFTIKPKPSSIVEPPQASSHGIQHGIQRSHSMPNLVLGEDEEKESVNKNKTKKPKGYKEK